MNCKRCKQIRTGKSRSRSRSRSGSVFSRIVSFCRQTSDPATSPIPAHPPKVPLLRHGTNKVPSTLPGQGKVKAPLKALQLRLQLQMQLFRFVSNLLVTRTHTHAQDNVSQAGPSPKTAPRDPRSGSGMWTVDLRSPRRTRTVVIVAVSYSPPRLTQEAAPGTCSEIEQSRIQQYRDSDQSGEYWPCVTISDVLD